MSAETETNVLWTCPTCAQLTLMGHRHDGRYVTPTESVPVVPRQVADHLADFIEANIPGAAIYRTPTSDGVWMIVT